VCYSVVCTTHPSSKDDSANVVEGAQQLQSSLLSAAAQCNCTYKECQPQCQHTQPCPAAVAKVHFRICNLCGSSFSNSSSSQWRWWCRCRAAAASCCCYRVARCCHLDVCVRCCEHCLLLLRQLLRSDRYTNDSCRASTEWCCELCSTIKKKCIARQQRIWLIEQRMPQHLALEHTSAYDTHLLLLVQVHAVSNCTAH
jgi:hypothetical protein